MFCLDLNIKRNNYKIKFSIFHKSSMIDISIHQNTFHHHNHKMAMFNFITNRMNNILMNKVENYQQLMEKEHTDKLNGYPNNLISKIIKRKQRRLLKREALIGNDILMIWRRY